MPNVNVVRWSWWTIGPALGDDVQKRVKQKQKKAARKVDDTPAGKRALRERKKTPQDLEYIAREAGRAYHHLRNDRSWRPMPSLRGPNRADLHIASP